MLSCSTEFRLLEVKITCLCIAADEVLYRYGAQPAEDASADVEKHLAGIRSLASADVDRLIRPTLGTAPGQWIVGLLDEAAELTLRVRALATRPGESPDAATIGLRESLRRRSMTLRHVRLVADGPVAAFLGLTLEHGPRTVARAGFDKPVSFGGKTRAWTLVSELFNAGDGGLPRGDLFNAVWSDRSHVQPNNIDQHKSHANNVLEPLLVEIAPRAGVWRLAEV